MLDEHKVDYAYMSIANSVANMRRFLKLRDTEPCFDQIRAEGRIGFPAFLLSDGTVTLDVDEVLAKAGEA